MSLVKAKGMILALFFGLAVWTALERMLIVE